MNENINLCELLKGHEGETFYTTIYGNCELYRINDGTISISNRNFFSYFNLESDGKFCTEGECVIFPSKEQRDWNKWAEEQKPKVPKTWGEIKSCNVEVWQAISNLDYGVTEPVVKAVLALLKIHQLIEVGYGSNVSYDEWLNEQTYTIVPDGEKRNLEILVNPSTPTVLLFHSNEQAREFFSYPENEQLIKDFYQI